MNRSAAETPAEQHDPQQPPSAGAHSRPLSVLLLSLLWPGFGHWPTPARRRGVAIAGATLVIFLVGLSWFLLTRRPSDVALLAVRSRWLTALVVASLATLAFRLAVTVDAIRAGGGWSLLRSWVARLTIPVVVLAMIAPHGLVARYALQQRDLITTVFTADDSATAFPTPLAPSQQDRTPSESSTSTTIPTPNRAPLPAGGAAGPAATAAVDRLESWNGQERLTVALLGSDGGYDRVGIRTDTIIVLSIEVRSGRAVAFSIPRNWTRMPFPDGTAAAAAYPSGYPGLANAIYGLGSSRPRLFPDSDDPGAAAVKASLAQLLGLPIQYYALLDMAAVVETVDLFGGIDLNVTEYIDDVIKPIEPGGAPLVIRTEPGKYHFDGATTLAYVRSRVQSSDYSRMARQRCVVGAMLGQVGVMDVLAKYHVLAEIIADHVRTDVPLDRLPDLIEVTRRLDTERITTVNFVPPEFPNGRAPIEKVRKAVDQALDTAPETDEQIASVCGEAA